MNKIMNKIIHSFKKKYKNNEKNINFYDIKLYLIQKPKRLEITSSSYR